MDDPLPENVDGKKVQQVTHEFSHSVDHHIPWGQVMLGAGLLVLSYVLYRAFLAESGSDSDEQPDFETEDATGVDVEGDGLMTSKPW